MKTKECLVAFAASFACLTPAFSQEDPTAADPIPAEAADLPDNPPVEAPVDDDADPVEPVDTADPVDEPMDTDEPADPVGDEEDIPDQIDLDEVEENPIEEDEEGGLSLKDAELNELFEYLAKKGGYGYLANSRLTGPEYQIQGSIPASDPLEQMRAIAQFKNVELYTDRGIIYALDQSQLGQLPAEEWTYQLKYLRPGDFENLQNLIQPMLTPGTGRINIEPKTNTIVIIDTGKKIASVEGLLARIDKAKGQIVIETKILRSNRLSGTATGVDWSSSLGRNTGLTFDVINDVNDLFGLGDYVGPYNFTNPAFAAQGGGGGGAQVVNEANGAGLVLSPLQFTGILRALRDSNCTTQEGNPTLITEDNEEAILSIIDRVPIITQQIGAGGLGGNLQAEEVRYTIDEADPTIATDPTNTREIGVTVSVTPTVLPDNTIRMKLRPRSAQITEQVPGTNPGITFPRVQESTIETISRVPNNHTLLLGGFYSTVENNRRNKVPILGDIPVINFLFKSDVQSEEQTSLVFCVTPRAYDPSSAAKSDSMAREAEQRISIRKRCTHLGCDETCDYQEAEIQSYSPKGQHVNHPRRTGGKPRMNPFSRRR